MSLRLLVLLLSVIWALLPWEAQAAPSADVCEWAARQAAAETGVPADILGALTLTETGRRTDGVVRPWAWSANAEGEGAWFDDPQSAIAFAEQRVAMGRPNVDIGCFQLNYRWHGQHFQSVAQMFDPLTNARYAAEFVRGLYAETGDWRVAAGAFHSRTPVHANRYLARFDTLRDMLHTQGFAQMTDAPETYNQFQIAQAGPRREPRPRVMLLGAPLGSLPSGQGASLAVINAPRGPMISVRAAMLSDSEGAGRGSLWR